MGLLAPNPRKLLKKVGSADSQYRPCHPERQSKSEQSEDQIMRSIIWDLGRKKVVIHYRSRFAPSLRSGSNTKMTHRVIFSAQDDTLDGCRR